MACSFIFNMSEFRSFRNILNFDALSMYVVWGKAFSHFLAVFGVFDWIIYIECTDVTSLFFHRQTCRRIQINR